MNQINIEQREAALKRIVSDAGNIALEHFRTREPGEYTLKGNQDFLTEADMLVEQYIIATLTEHFPEDAILGEETGSNNRDVAAIWVIDPIDGTANFARGIEHFCISIAFVSHGVTELGAIYNPATEELYLAYRGRYAHKNNRPLQVASTDEISTATVELGWSNRIPQKHYLNIMNTILNHGANIRRGASGALALAWVAEGRTDGYAELHMNAWDCLAGLLMVREAGGCTGTFPDNNDAIFAGGPILAATPAIANDLASATNIPLVGDESLISPEKTEQPALGQQYKRGDDLAPLSLIESDVPGWGMNIYIGGSIGVSDLDLLEKNNIKTVINCAVNLDIDWVSYSQSKYATHLINHGAGPIRYYKLGLVDGAGNEARMMHAGYQQMRAALLQKIPEKVTYRNKERGNILVNCRGGRSRSVTLVSLFLHLECPERYPTLTSAIEHVRAKRELHPDEWFEAPKPSLVAMAKQAVEMEQALKTAGFCSAA